MSSITVGNSHQINYAIDIKNQKFNKFALIIDLLQDRQILNSLNRANRTLKSNIVLQEVKEKLADIILLLNRGQQASFWINNNGVLPVQILINQLPETGCKSNLENVTERILAEIEMLFWHRLK